MHTNEEELKMDSFSKNTIMSEEEPSLPFNEAFDVSEPQDLGALESSDSNKEALEKRQKKETKESQVKQFVEFTEEFEKLTDVEAKLKLAIAMMEASLSFGGVPSFRNFWEARKLCLPLFKENIQPPARTELWTKYSDLSREARRLKEILDEQSAFAVEQIEMAVKALESDIQLLGEQIAPAHLQIPDCLKAHAQKYLDIQGELNLLNAQAARINALRKELIKTEMRVRQKNQFFQRLSFAGDRVFPRRKELIKEISTHFSDDVERFVKVNFSQEAPQDSVFVESLFALREEIKLLQGLAKEFTLNTTSFTQTRKKLSECWDKVKLEEKERKKERVQQRVVQKENAEKHQQNMQALKQQIQDNQLSLQEAANQIDSIAAAMRQTDLGRDDLKPLKDMLGEIRKSIQDKIRAEEAHKQQQEQERDLQKREKIKKLRESIQSLVREHDQYDAETLAVKRDEMSEEISLAKITKLEKQELEKLIKPLRDLITEKKERALLDLSEDDKSNLAQLKEILKQRQDRRQEIKSRLESLRKACGSSGLDFEKAMGFQSQIEEEKQRLEKAILGIKEIEDKILKLGSL